MGQNEVTATWPEFIAEMEEIGKTPVAILDRQLVKRFNKAGMKVLVQWLHSSEEEATWEFYDALQKKFPGFLCHKSLRIRILLRGRGCYRPAEPYHILLQK